MTTVTDIVPRSSRVSPSYPQYSTGEERQMLPYQQPKRQPWSPETSQDQFLPDSKTKGDAPSSWKKHCNVQLFVCFFIGLVICGIPLAVIASLYAQRAATPPASNSDSSSSGSSSSNLPMQCTNYVTNSDPTRLVSSTICMTCYSQCDNSALLPVGWYRFTDGAGTRLSTVPASSGSCGANSPAYFNGTLPTTRGSTTTGTACVNSGGNLCSTGFGSITVSATLCDGYYVFYLSPFTSCSVRYCTAM